MTDIHTHTHTHRVCLSTGTVNNCFWASSTDLGLYYTILYKSTSPITKPCFRLLVHFLWFFFCNCNDSFLVPKRYPKTSHQNPTSVPQKWSNWKHGCRFGPIQKQCYKSKIKENPTSASVGLQPTIIFIIN